MPGWIHGNCPLKYTMQEYNNIDKEAGSGNRLLSVRRSAIIGTGVFLILFVLVAGYIYQRYENLQREQKVRSLSIANNARSRLQETLYNSLSATKILSFFIDEQGTVKGFDSIAIQILNTHKHIDALQLVPNGVIRYVYPLAGNAKVLGYDILNDSARNKEAIKAIQKNTMFFSGPYELRQGGFGIVGRLPVFRQGKFWGFSAVVIKMTTLLRAAEIDSSGKNGYYYQLSKVNAQTGQKENFIPYKHTLPTAHSVSVDVPNGEWELSVTPVNPYRRYRDIVSLGVLGLLLSLLGGIFAYNEARKPQRLNQLVKERTMQLKKSEENYKILFEKSPLPLWIYDINTFRFIEVNDAAINLYGYTREEFLSMDIFALRISDEQGRAGEDDISQGAGLKEAETCIHVKKNREQMQVLVFSRSIRYDGINGMLALLMDVSEKTRVENELRKSEEKYRSLIEKASDGIILYSFDGTIDSFNRAACLQTGYSPEAFSGLNMRDLFFEADFDKYSPGHKKNNGKEPASTFYRKLKRKDGSLFNVELNSTMLPDGKIIAIVRDITERERIEAALKESEEKFSKSFHTNSIGFAIFDNDFRFVDVNEVYASILETDPESLLGKLADDAGLSSKIDAASREAISLHIEDILNREGKLHHFEIQIYNKSGKVITVLLSIEKLDLRNAPHWLTSAVDITEKKNAEMLLEKNEHKYRSLIEQASDGIVITDMQGNIIEVNRSVCRMGGYEMDEVVGKHLIKFIPQEDIVDNPFQFEALSTGVSIMNERRLLRKDGAIIDIEINSKLASANTLISFVRDITERKKNDEVLRYHARLLDSISDAVVSLNMNREIVSWNNACEKLFGFTETEVKGKRIPSLVVFEYPNNNNEAVFKQVYEEGSWKGEFNFIHPETSKKFNLLSSINLLKNSKGDNIGFIITSSDITDRKIAEEKIRKSNERFEMIAMATNEIIWDHDFNLNETWGNRKLYELHGIEDGKGKITFEMFLNRIHPSERENVQLRMEAALAKKQEYLTEELQMMTAGGEYRFFYDRAFIKYDAMGEPIRILGAMQDITDRETIKKQILREKELSDSIINSLPGIFYLFTKDGRYLRWNKNLESVTGYSADEISKLHPLQLISEPEREWVTGRIENVFISGSDNAEAKILLKNGEHIPYYFTGQAIEYEGELCLMGVGLDFSDKEKAEKAILASEAKYKELIEQASDGIFISDSTGRYIDVNTSACKMLGYEKEELLNMSGSDILYHAADIENLHKSYDALKSGESYIREVTLRKKDNSPLEVESSSKMISDGRFIGIVRDLTERKKVAEEILSSKRQFQNLVENITGVYWVNNLETHETIYISPSYETIWGKPVKEIYENPMAFINSIHPDDMNLVMASYHSLTETLKENITYRIIRPDGELRWISALVNVVPDSKGNKLEYGYAEDITERKKAAEEIKANSELLRELYSYQQNIREEERTHIAREIHDELGQQLTGLKMDLFWINRKLQPADNAISEKLLSTLALIDTTIETVRRIATELRPSILDDLGLVAALDWQSDEFEKRSSIKVDFSSKLQEALVMPDIATALFRIYQELLTNVARHSKASIVKAAIWQEGEKLYLKVEDNGQGFDMSNILNKKTLGLRGIKERTSLIGGTYEIKSNPGSGTSVLISVPLHIAGTKI